MTKAQIFKLIKRQIEASRFEAHVRHKLLKRLNRLHRQVKGRIGEQDLDKINKRELNKLIKDIDDMSITAHKELISKIDDYSIELSNAEADFIYRVFENWELPKNKPQSFSPLVLGLTSKEWLSKQANDYAHSVKMAVRNNDSIEHLERQFANKTKAFTSTWSRSVSQQTHDKIAKKSNKVKGYWHVSVLDGKTSDVCLVRSNKRWSKNGEPIGHDLALKMPPLHPHCRSAVVAITDVNKEPATMTVDDWLDSMSDSEQDEVLGKGKALMYRNGQITLRDLLDQSGRPSPLYKLQEKLEDSKVSSMIKAYRTPWADDFPDILIAHSTATITGHDSYSMAKAGELKQALKLVDEIVSDDFLIKISEAFRDVKDLHILPVHAEESTGRNKIPLAYAELLKSVLGAKIETNVVQASKAYRTHSDGINRLINRVAFSGEVVKGRKYLLVDDVVTQGGTIADLKGYIEWKGGYVVGSSTLSGKAHSAKIAIRKPTLGQLRKQAGKEIGIWWQEEFGYGFEKFTESEARYLTKQIHRHGVDDVRDKLIKGRSKKGS